MNDVPAIVGWIIAVVLAIAAGVAWLVLRNDAAPAPPRWRSRTIAWVLASSTLGPPCVVAIILTLGAISNFAALVRAPAQYLGDIIGGFLFLVVWYVAVALAFFALPYLPILLLWTRICSRLGRFETSRRGVIAAAILLALPATIASVIAYGLQESPFGYRGWELVRFGFVIQLCVSVSLLVPRLALDALRPGVFSEMAGHIPQTLSNTR